MSGVAVVVKRRPTLLCASLLHLFRSRSGRFVPGLPSLGKFLVPAYSVFIHFCSGLTTCYSHDLLKHMLLLLRIKGYAEGPEEIRGRSAVRTRKVCMTYAGRPNTSTRKVFGSYRFASAVVGNSRPARVRAYAEGPSLDGSVTTGHHSRPFRAYAEGPRCMKSVRGESANGVRGRATSRETHPYAEGPHTRVQTEVHPH